MSKLDRIAQLVGTRLEVDAGRRAKTVGATVMHGAYDLELGRITADPNQPRKHFDDDDLRLLANSLREHGQIEPVVVRYDEAADRYVLIAGERRYRAALLIGLRSLRAIVDERGLTADRITEMQLVENALRCDLSPLEAAAAFRDLMATWNCNQQQLAQRLHISQSKVSRTLALLDLPKESHTAVMQGEVAPTVAVKREAAKRSPKSGRAAKPKRVTLRTPAGQAVVIAKPGHTVADVLAAALDAARGRAAA